MKKGFTRRGVSPRLPRFRPVPRCCLQGEQLEKREVLNAAFDLIGVTGPGGLRSDPEFAGIDGSGVTVAVIDSGIDTDHPALAGAILQDFHTPPRPVGRNFFADVVNVNES